MLTLLLLFRKGTLNLESTDEQANKWVARGCMVIMGLTKQRAEHQRRAGAIETQNNKCTCAHILGIGAHCMDSDIQLTTNK
jgi:hypothetical protein